MAASLTLPLQKQIVKVVTFNQNELSSLPLHLLTLISRFQNSISSRNLTVFVITRTVDQSLVLELIS